MNWFTTWNNRKRVLGMNERNLTYIKQYNEGKAKKIADDKLLTKQILEEAEIPTPKLIGSISNIRELNEFDWDLLPESFVIKPVSGLEGGGIEIFFNRDKSGNWIKADGSRWSLEDIEGLASDIIDGKYSLHNQPDQVFFEERIRIHKSFQYYSYKGVPDIRVIVFNSIPIMAMLRLPTKESDGKGNLQKGAIGAGIDITTGVTTSAIRGKSEHIEHIPNTKLNISGLKIPYWSKILEYSVDAQRATGLYFAGIDFLIDRDKGPMIIEMNARPGLSIQLANKDGLRWRLRKARGIKVQSEKKGIRLGKDLFGGAIEEDIERISGKDLIGIIENVTVYDAKNLETVITGEKLTKKADLAEIKTKAKIDTGADSSSMDYGLAKKLGYTKYIEKFEEIKIKKKIDSEEHSYKDLKVIVDEINEEFENTVNDETPLKIKVDRIRSSHGASLRLYVPIKITLGDITYETMANIYDRSNLSFKMIIGRKSLSKFLVEPNKVT